MEGPDSTQHLECRGKLQADSCRAHPLHLERANEAQSQLPRLHLEQEVLCRQPDLLTQLIGQGWSPIGLPLRALGGPQECSADLHPHPPAPAYVGLYRGHCRLVLRQWGLVERFSPGTHGAGRYVVPFVSGNGGPPKSLSK